MFDSVSANGIPPTAKIVAGYIDGRYAWTPAEWALFPKALKVRIAVFPTTDDGRVLDVEWGDATPEQAPGWVKMRRASKTHPLDGPACVYTSAANWQAVRQAFMDQGVPQPDYWIAKWDGKATVPAGAVAKQYQSLTSYDLSVTIDSWPVASPAPKPPTPPEALVTIHDVEVKITNSQTTQLVDIPFSTVASATLVAGSGPNDPGNLTIAAAGNQTALVVRSGSIGTVITVRLGVL